MVFILLLPIFTNAISQDLSKEEIIQAANNKLPEALSNLSTLLQIPNDGHYSDQVINNLEWCHDKFTNLGFDVQTLSTNGEPLLFAQKTYHKKSKTALFYLQIDGQPVDTSAWDQPSPYTPVFKQLAENGIWETIGFPTGSNIIDPDWRIFARSASDSKGPAMAFISALEILLEKNLDPAYNIKVIMDFQEELGSPDLPEAVKRYHDLLSADMILIMDGARHISNIPTLCYGARGIAMASIVVFGPKTPLHSGQYGNFAPNPVFAAAKLISSFKDDEGRVLIPGFYDDVNLTAEEKLVLAQIPEDINALQKRIGIARPDHIGDTYQESLQYPSLNVRGLKSAWVGKEVRTIIPSEVIIEIDIRLVPESDGERLIGLLRKHIQDQGFHLVDSVPNDEERMNNNNLASFTHRFGSSPFRTDIDSPIATMLNLAMARIFDDQVVNMRTTGGSQPIGAFINTLKVPAVSVRIPNPDNSIHSPNENLRIGNFLEGIEACLSILTQH